MPRAHGLTSQREYGSFATADGESGKQPTSPLVKIATGNQDLRIKENTTAIAELRQYSESSNRERLASTRTSNERR